MTQNHYPITDPNPNFPAIEEQVLALWKAHNVFAASVEQRPATQNGQNNHFIFYDGPPFANGLPHYGHLLTGFVKDVFARYQTQKGKRVERRFGWDCHGLPAEMGAEKELGISGRQAITAYGIGKFNDYCRDNVMRYAHEWERYVNRQARWVDFENDYKTMDKDFMESVLWAFKQLYEKGWVYEAYRVMPYSWAAETPLSNFETKLDNAYREREDKAVTVAFALEEVPEDLKESLGKIYSPENKSGELRHTGIPFKKYHILAWTTTPWTLPSNLALAVSEKLSYGAFYKDDALYIASRSFIDQNREELKKLGYEFSFPKCVLFGDSPNSDGSLLHVNGEKLVGLSYKPLFPYFATTLETERLTLRPFRLDDWKQFHAFENDPKITAGMAAGALDDVRLRAEFDRFIAEHQTQGFSQWGVFEKETGAFVGRAGFDLRDYQQFNTTGQEAIELRYALGSNYWGKGYATELGKALLDWAAHHTTATLVNAGTHEGNDGSLKLLKKLGFQFERPVMYKGKEVQYFTFDLAAHRPTASKPMKSAAFRILAGDFIEEGSGTGVVHMAPGFGEDDQKCCEANGIEVVVPVDGQGKYTDSIFDLPDLQLKGLNVIAENVAEYKFGEANERIIRWLKDHGHLIKQEQIKHNYPHCWRTDTPLIYRAMSSWYVEVTKFRDRAAELNKQINWIPAHIRDGQMGHMLATAPDWSISRNRFWGTPIPVWRSKSGKVKVFGSIAEIEQASGQKITDLHRPIIDDVVITDGGEEYRRVEDVFDCWFESGSMPFAQLHYPFENKEQFENNFPADFITEYVGQTRGWFNTLIMLSTALFDKPPFKNCICHGVVLDAETGLKYSKRLKNYKDPIEVIDQFGSDALRWLMLSSPVMRGQDLMVDPEGKFIRDVVRLAIKPIWNAYHFFTLYANADGVKAKSIHDSHNPMDTYILAECRQAVIGMQEALDRYDTPAATEAVLKFFGNLNNWYIRRNKERFWKAEHDADKQAAYDSLYTVLTIMCAATAPLLPLTCEEIYRNLTGEESVHLADWPDVSKIADSEALLAPMWWVMDVCTAALSVRNKINIRIRQPLHSLTVIGKPIPCTKEEMAYYFQLIEDEVNIKKVSFSEQADELTQYADLKLQIHSAVLGKRLPEKMKQILPASKKGEWRQVEGAVEICGEKLQRGEYTLQLEPKPNYKDNAQALSTNDALVILDTNLTPELIAEGLARDLVRLVQDARKSAGLHVADHISLRLQLPDALVEGIKTHGAYVAEQVLATAVSYGVVEGDFTTEQMLDGKAVGIGITRAQRAAA